MITQSILKIDHEIDKESPIFFAPYGEQELDAFLPMSPEGLHLKKDLLQQLAGEISASQFIAYEHEASHRVSWGMYKGEVTANRFLGTIDVRQLQYGKGEDLKYTTVLQEMGTFIMDPAERGKGIGSLAKLAIIQHTIKEQGTRVFEAHALEHNTPSQSSLAKIGFTHMDTYPEYDFPQGELSQLWTIGLPNTHKALARGNEEKLVQLQAGWSRYETLLKTITVVEIDA